MKTDQLKVRVHTGGTSKDQRPTRDDWKELFNVLNIAKLSNMTPNLFFSSTIYSLHPGIHSYYI